MSEKKGLIHKLGQRYIDKTISRLESNTSQAYILNESQQKALNRVAYKTYFWSAVIGALAVVIVVLPVHIWPNLFGIQKFNLFGNKIEFEVYYTLYAVAMLFPEIWTLNYLNLRAVKKICLICNHPNKNRQDYKDQISLLTEAGLEIPAKHLKELYIDPYVGLSKFSYYSVFLFMKLKATLSNIVVKLLVKRFLGRYALRIVTDLAGIPIFAFWNAWASRAVIKETRMRVMASAATADFLEEITLQDLESVKHKIGLIFHFVAQKKRSYNFAIYAYIKEVLLIIPTIQLKISHEVDVKELFTGDDGKDRIIAKLLVFGLIVDGHLSIKEKLVLKNLTDEVWFPYATNELELAVSNYCKGRGLPLL